MRDHRSHASDGRRRLDSFRSQNQKDPQARGKKKARETLTEAKPGRLPKFVRPQLARLVDETPGGAGWIHEIKFDGYRTLARFANGKLQMLTREGKDWTHRYPFLAEHLEGLGLDRTILDGEVVWLNPEGHSDFQGLQTALREERHDELVYYVFDLLYLNGRSLLKLPLATRKERLKELLSPLSSNGPIRFSDHIVGQGEDLFETSCRLKLEGIVSKRADRPYKHGRSDDWLKSKCVNRQELVIGGYTEPQGARKHFGALLLGAHDREGRLRFVGKAGTGFTSKTLKELISRMKPLETRESPFMNPPTEPGVHWVQPSLVAEVNLASWTHHGNVRQASFQGLREDKPAEKVVYESPKHLEDIVQPKAPAKTKSKRSLAAEVTGSKPRSKSRRLPEPPALELTSPDKILFEDVGLTKLELAEYYDFVAPWMVPYLKDRPLTLLRCPDGRHHQCFIQRHASKNMDEDIEVFTLKGKAAGPHMKISSADGLTALVQLGTLEIHCWAGRQPNL
ncbi:MAG TPA: DNA ligase D, partial [Bdellovibrionales bacterium]|nr:DNA ligase D [Bdellovibrionales bacterium]